MRTKPTEIRIQTCGFAEISGLIIMSFGIAIQTNSNPQVFQSTGLICSDWLNRISTHRFAKALDWSWWTHNGGIESKILKWQVPWSAGLTLHWRHNDHDGASNHQPHGCLLNRLFRRRSKKTSKLRVTGLCVGNSPGPVNSPHKGPVTRKMFPFDDVIMIIISPVPWNWIPSAGSPNIIMSSPSKPTQIARFMGPTWGPSGADRTQVDPMLAPWTLLSGQNWRFATAII